MNTPSIWLFSGISLLWHIPALPAMPPPGSFPLTALIPDILSLIKTEKFWTIRSPSAVFSVPPAAPPMPSSPLSLSLPLLIALGFSFPFSMPASPELSPQLKRSVVILNYLSVPITGSCSGWHKTPRKCSISWTAPCNHWTSWLHFSTHLLPCFSAPCTSSSFLPVMHSCSRGTDSAQSFIRPVSLLISIR